MKTQDDLIESLIAGGIIGSSLGALLTKNKTEGKIIGALLGAAISATTKANEEASKLRVPQFIEENGNLYEISASGEKHFIKNLRPIKRTFSEKIELK